MSLGATKVTDNTHEMSLADLTSQTLRLLIPLFQREYVWTKKQLDRLTRELDSIVEGEDTNRFLGAIIAVRRLTNPAEPQLYEIVDGQQRLATLYLFVIASVEVAASKGHIDYATSLYNAHAIMPFASATSVPINTKLVPSYSDRAQFNAIFKMLFTTKAFTKEDEGRLRLPESTGDPNGKLIKQYARIKAYLIGRYREAETNDAGFGRLQSIVQAAMSCLTFVFIVLKDPASATTVFEGLNDSGMPIGTGDLVRNELFARVGDDWASAKTLHTLHWLPFQERLGKNFDDFFFPYCVIQDSAARKADMFGSLRNQWGKEVNPSNIIALLDQYSIPFLAISTLDLHSEFSTSIQLQLRRLVEIRRPAAVYPFVMQLLRGNLDRKVTSEDASSCLATLESFLVRRAICGIEPTGLLGLFRTMWTNLQGAPTSTTVAAVILKRLTVEWPDDERLRDSILTRRFYKSAISEYAIREYDSSLGADVPDGSPPWIEHVLPQTPTSEWKIHFDDKNQLELCHTWGNLVPLTSKMNMEVSNQSYKEKREVFMNDSMYGSARRLAENFDEWTPDAVKQRGKEIGDWAVTRWPRPN